MMHRARTGGKDSDTEEQLIATISSTTLLDEVASYWGNGIHEGNLLRDLKGAPARLRREIRTLQAALDELPPLDGVKNEELRILLQVTWNRIRRLLPAPRAARRLGLGRGGDGAERRTIRLQSVELMAGIEKRHQRYPEARLFEQHANPTSYEFGYAWPATVRTSGSARRTWSASGTGILSS